MESIETNLEIDTQNIDAININIDNNEEQLTQCQDNNSLEENTDFVTEIIESQQELDIELDHNLQKVNVGNVITDFNDIFSSPKVKSLNDSIFSPFLSDEEDNDDSQSNSFKKQPLIDRLEEGNIMDDIYSSDAEENDLKQSLSEPIDTIQQLSQDIFGFDDDSDDEITPKVVTKYKSSDDEDDEEEKTQAQNDSEYGLSSDNDDDINNKKKKKSKKEIRREKRAEKKEKKEAKKAAKRVAKIAAKENNSDESDAKGGDGSDAATDVDSSDYDSENNSGDDKVAAKPIKEINENKSKKENKKSAVETEIEVVLKLESGPTEGEMRKLILMEIDEDELEERKYGLRKYINQEMKIDLKSAHKDNFKLLIDTKKWLNELRYNGNTMVQKWIHDEFKFNYTENEIKDLLPREQKILKRKKDRLLRNDNKIIDVLKFLDNKEDKDDEDDYDSDSSSDSNNDKEDVNTTNEEIILFSESEEDNSENEIDQADIFKKLEQEKEIQLKLELQKMGKNQEKKRILKSNVIKPLNARSELIRGLRQQVRATASETYCKEISSKKNSIPLTIEQLSQKLKIEEKCRQFIVMLKEHEEYLLQLEKNRKIHEEEEKEVKRKQIRYDSDDSDDEFDENVDIGGKAEDYEKSDNESEDEVGDMNDTIPDELKNVDASIDMNSDMDIDMDNFELNEVSSDIVASNNEIEDVIVPVQVIKTYGRKFNSINTSNIDVSNKDIHHDEVNESVEIKETNEDESVNDAIIDTGDDKEHNLSKELDDILNSNDDVNDEEQEEESEIVIEDEKEEEEEEEEEEVVLSPEEIKRIEKQKKQEKINRLRAMYEEDDRKHSKYKSSEFIDDQADEEDEFDNKQSGLGDFGFGVTNRDNEADALKIRKSDFDLFADEDDDDVGDEEAAVKARMEMQLKEDRDLSKKIILGVTEGFKANHNKKDKYFADLVNTHSNNIDLYDGANNGEVVELDEEELLLKKIKERQERDEYQPAEFDDDDDDEYADEEEDESEDENILTEQEIQSRLQKKIEKLERKKIEKIERKILAEKSKMNREIRKLHRQESQMDRSNSQQIINTRLISFDNDNDINQISPRSNTNSSIIADVNDENRNFITNDISNHGYEKQNNTTSSNQVGVKRKSAFPSKRQPTTYNDVANKLQRSNTLYSNSSKVIMSSDSNQIKRSNSALSGVLDESDRFGGGMAVNRNIPSLNRQMSVGSNSNAGGLTRSISNGGTNASKGSFFTEVTGLKRSISSVIDTTNISNKLNTMSGSKIRSFGNIAKKKSSFNAGGAVSVAGAKYVFQISNNNENDGNSMHGPSNNSNWGNTAQVSDSKMGSNGASSTVPNTSNLIRSSSMTLNSTSSNAVIRKQDSSISLFEQLNSKNNATGGLKRGTSFRSLA